MVDRPAITRMMTQNSLVDPHHESDRTSVTNAKLSDAAPVLGLEAEALISCNQRLQELGINNTIKIPQICVIGDQSTGKSSLVEALSTIKVPKAKGCCTQCPLAINLSSGQTASSPWKCVVSIEERYYFDESPIQRSVTKNNKFGPWQERTEIKVTHVKTTTNKDEVIELIRAAQHAILNPGTRAQDFLAENGFTPSSAQSVKFSPNIIRLDVSEGRWPNLSFIDLPGVIANTGKEKEKYLVKLIRNLVHQYAATESSVNMLTLPMTHDIENSQACAIIQELKVERRTLAVFTKADLADDEQRTVFLNRFLGDEDLGFEHGYHFVVMPEVGQKEARAQECELFTQEPWSGLYERFRSRLGVDALRKYLRNLLFEKTKESLPGSLRSLRERLNSVDQELITLPEPPNEALLPLQLQQSVTRFENTMKTIYSGDPGDTRKSARVLWTDAISGFKDEVEQAQPTIFFLTRTERDRLRKVSTMLEGDIMEASENETARPPTVKADNSIKEESDLKYRHRFRLEDIRDLNDQYYQSCIPGGIELRAVEEMNKLSVQHWDKLLDNFMGSNSTLLNQQVIAEVEKAFGHYRHLEVFSVIVTYVKTYIDGAVQAEWNIAEEMCKLEQKKPLSYDTDNLKEKEKRCLKLKTNKRHEERSKLAKAEFAANRTSSRKKDAYLDQIGPDPYENELRMSAQNRAYYEVAMTRFVDCISLGIMGRLLPACTEELAEQLKEHLGLNDHSKHDQIVRWMAEDKSRENRRRALVHEKQRLTEGLHYIEEVLGKSAHFECPKRRRPEGGEPADEPKTPSKRAKKTPTNRKVQPVQPSTLNGPLSLRMSSIEIEDD